jgi:hypothetical protein
MEGETVCNCRRVANSRHGYRCRCTSWSHQLNREHSIEIGIFAIKGYVFVEVIYRRANNIKLLNEMMMVECSVTTRDMICHNVEEV